MAEHKIRKNNIIYIIPDDELFEKWQKDEAFIDDYGRLMNRKPHRVLRELKHFAEDEPMSQQCPETLPMIPSRNSSSVVEQFKEKAQEKAIEIGESFIDYAADKFFYEVLPNVWREHIVPFYYRTKEAITSKELKAETIISSTSADNVVETDVTPNVGQKLTKEEAYEEKRKVLYHWIGLFSSLKKLRDAGEIDIDSILVQLTDPVMLERVNVLLDENPNLIETDKYIELHSLLGRNLYLEKQLIPISAEEITEIAITFDNNTRTEDNMEARHDG